MGLSGRLRRLGDARAAAIGFVIVELAAIPLLLSWGNKWWFWADDWDFLSARTGGNLGDLFRAHYQHWTTLPIVAYRLMWLVVGIRSYVPYQLMIIALHLTAVALLRLIMRRAGVRPWLATLLAVVFVFFGAGAENIVIAFQITFVGSIVFGLAQLLLADHDGCDFGSLDRRDWFGLLAGLSALMCSGVGVAMVVVVGLAVLARRGWRIALVHTVPLATTYLVWAAVSPKGQSTGNLSSQSPWQVVQFVALGVGSAFGRLAQVPLLGIVLALVLLVGLGVAMRRLDRREVCARYSVPLALLAGALIFLVVTGLVRSGQPGPLAGKLGNGPGRARQSRYVYIVAAMSLPALAVAADAIARRWRALTVPIVVLLVAGVPGNIHRLRNYTNQSSLDRAKFRTAVLEAPRLPLADRLPRAEEPAALYASFGGLTLGWLVDSLPSHRIPAPGRVTRSQIATYTVNLALRPNKVPARVGCGPLDQPARRTLRVFQRFTVRSGAAAVRYFAPDGGVSQPLLIEPGQTYIATTGPLDVEIAPVRPPVELCG